MTDERVKELHAAWCRDWGREDMAMSLDTLLALSALARTYAWERVIDCGSGLSTLILRESLPAESILTAMDTDPHFARHTDAAMRALCGPIHGQVHAWDPLVLRVLVPDLIVWDLGDLNMRRELLPIVTREKQATIIFDDCHNAKLAAKIAELRSNARPFSKPDQWGRFAMISEGNAW